MSIRRASSLQWLALATVLFAVGCDSNPTTTVSSPSPISGRAVASAGMSGVSITPSQIQPVVIVGAVCPDPRFVAPFALGLVGNGFTDQFLVQVDVQFVNRLGVTTPNLSITRETLIQRFTSTRIGAIETRTFPLEFPFGCAGAVPPGTLTVAATVVDSQQRERRTVMTMPVR
jgi:hypothetical protein